MSKERFKKNHIFFTNSNVRRPGGVVGYSLHPENKAYNPAAEDTKNRRNVVERMEGLIKDGKTLDEAAKEVFSDENVQKQFEYLKKAGIDLETVFKSWYDGYQRRNKQHKNFYMNGNGGLRG